MLILQVQLYIRVKYSRDENKMEQKNETDVVSNAALFVISGYFHVCEMILQLKSS